MECNKPHLPSPQKEEYSIAIGFSTFSGIFNGITIFHDFSKTGNPSFIFLCFSESIVASLTPTSPHRRSKQTYNRTQNKIGKCSTKTNYSQIPLLGPLNLSSSSFSNWSCSWSNWCWRCCARRKSLLMSAGCSVIHEKSSSFMLNTDLTQLLHVYWWHRTSRGRVGTRLPPRTCDLGGGVGTHPSPPEHGTSGKGWVLTLRPPSEMGYQGIRVCKRAVRIAQ